MISAILCDLSNLVRTYLIKKFFTKNSNLSRKKNKKVAKHNKSTCFSVNQIDQVIFEFIVCIARKKILKLISAHPL